MTKTTFIVKSENIFTVRQGTRAPPPLARIVSSPLRWCIDNYGIYYNRTPLELQPRKVGVYLLKILLCVGLLIGCGSDMDEELPPPDPAVLETVIPKSGSTIAVNGSIALTFNKRPKHFTIDSANTYGFANEIKQKSFYGVISVRHAYRSVLILGPFTVPVTHIKVSWGAVVPQQSITLTYKVTGPDCCD